jgi:hypothetical protein
MEQLTTQNLPESQETKITSEVQKAIKDEVNTVNYTPMSSLPKLDTVIPLNLLGETLEFQAKLLASINNIDDYLMQKLNYRSKIALGEAFAAEQADGVATAIYQIENGNSLIIGDQAGTGKGRICAGVLRYAYENNYLPIFITEKDNLFTDIYRDITDIGGIGTIKREKKYLGKPLILNGYKSGGYKYDDDGNKIKLPSPTSILDDDGDEAIKAPTQEEIREILKSGEIPKGYDFIMLTYSQLAAKRSGAKKYDYLLDAGKKYKNGFIIVMDESHNATGTKSATGEKIRALVTKSSGCLFSSATFSKTPENMYLYALKNDMRKASVSTLQLLDIIKQGGERLIENMTASLAQVGQVITRLRRYDNCNVEYKFMRESDKESLFEKYDNTLKIYRQLLAYFNLKNLPFYNARKFAIERFAKLKKVEMVKEQKPVRSEYKKSEEWDEAVEEWEKRNKGKYLVKRFTAGEINRTQFNFIETLLFSLKAEFVTKIALGQLYGNPDYLENPKMGENWSLPNIRVSDKSVFKSNRKPVIAVRNTLEGIYSTLGLKVGDTIPNGDFIIYVKALIQGALNGAISIQEIRVDEKEVEINEEFAIDLSDFEDKGEQYMKFLDDIKDVKLNIPVSPIDYVIQTIEEHERDKKYDTYGNGNPFFKVGEVTGRTKRLIKLENGQYQLIENKKDKNKASAFKKFNNGTYDVLLINESGSTGASAHSSIRVSDQRPRVMIIHQVELDVNQEVQKRGRINRTGMVNYPTYIYAISRIPSEIRRLLMLAKKLRKLDANTTGNQKQSKALSQIIDSEGNPVEDIINKYGDEVLNEFLEDEQNNEIYGRYKLKDEDKGRALLSGELQIESFIRQLELAPAAEQEFFFDSANILFKQIVEDKKSKKIYDLETELIDLQAAIINRLVLKQGDNTSPFNTSIFIEDNKALVQDIPMEKSQVDEYIKKLAGGQDPDENYKSIKDDLSKEQENHIAEVVEAIQQPDYKSAKTKEEKDLLKQEYEAKVASVKEKLGKDYVRLKALFEFFRIGKPCKIPAFPNECEPDEEGNTNVTTWNNGRFVGIIIGKSAKYKYSAMNIEFVFCQIEGSSKVKFKPTAKSMPVLNAIVEKTKYIDVISLEKIGLWQVNKDERRPTKLITGNLIEGYSAAKTITSQGEEYSKVFEFIKFTTVDKLSIRYGIKLNMTPYRMENVNSPKVLYNINQDALINLMLDPNQESSGYNSASTIGISILKNTAGVGFFGGIYRWSGKSSSKENTEKNTKYYSRFYNDPKILEITKKYGVDATRNRAYMRLSTGTTQLINYLSITVEKIRPDAKNMLKELLDYVASNVDIKIELKNINSEDVIKGEQDPYKPSDSKEEEQKEGKYVYRFLSPAQKYLDSIMASSKYQSHNIDNPLNQKVTFKFRPLVGEAVSWNIMPINPTPDEIVFDTFSILDDSEKIKLRIDLKKAIEENKSDMDIYNLVLSKIRQRLLVLKTIFGKIEKIEDIALIFKNFIKGVKESPDKKAEKGEDEGEGDIPAPEPVELSMETAQDFVLLLSSKIK